MTLNRTFPVRPELVERPVAYSVLRQALDERDCWGVGELEF